MKRFLVTMVALFALVFVANTTFAQDKWTPIVGVSYDYSVSPITNGSDFTFSATTVTTTSTDEGVATFGTVSGTVADGGTATTTIVWDNTGQHYLWITAVGTATDVCTNMRYVSVVPQANTLSATVTALGSATNTTVSEVCPDETGMVYDNTSPDDGTTTLYFKIELTASNDPAGTWNPNLSLDATGTIEYSFDGSSFGANPFPAATASSTVWVRFTEDNTTTAATFTADITGLEETLSAANGSKTVTPTTAPTDATLLLKALPFTGTLNFN